MPLSMANPETRAWTVLEPIDELDASTHSLASIRSLSISTISDSDTLIYIGTQSGSLILLSITPSYSRSSNLTAQPASLDASSTVSSSQRLSLVRSVAVSVSSVVRVHVLGGIEKVIVLCSDGFLYIVDSRLLLPVRRLTSLKGVSLIAKRVRSSDSECSNLYDSVNNDSELTSPSKRLLQKLGSGIRANGLKSKELERPREEGKYVFAALTGKRLILFEIAVGGRTGGRDRDNNDANESCFILKEILCFDGVSTMLWLNDSIIIGTAKGYFIISCITGESSLIFKLPESSSSPCLKLLRKEWKVLLLVDSVGITVDAYGQPIGGSLVFHDIPNSVAEISSYVVVVSNGRMKLYHRKSGSCIQTITLGGSATNEVCIVSEEEDNVGEVIAVALTNKVMCYRKLPCDDQIKDLLRRKNFKEALSLAEDLESAGEMSKDMLYFVHAQIGFLLLFDLQFEEAVNHFLLSETMQPSEIFSFVMKDPNRWSLLGPRNRYWALHPPPAPFEDVIDDGLLAAQRAIFLKKAGVETAVNDNFLLNSPSRSDLLESAVKHIIRYFEASRQKDLTLAVREGVDTLLMYLYRTLNAVDKMEKLASELNSCVVEELETLLEDSGHLRTLAFLYASKGMSSKALAIWRILGRSFPSLLLKKSSLNEGTPDATLDLSGKEAAAAEASKILEESPDQALVLQHLGWIADINQLFAVQILTSEKRLYQLSPDDVIRAIDTRKVEILQRFLQWLIEDKESSDPRFHTLYAISLAKSAIEAENGTQNLDAGAAVNTKVSDLRLDTIFEQPVRERLQIFLQSSDLYDPEEVLDLIEGSDLWLEKAILYRKLGQEELVLRILALKLEDSEAAEQYCAEIGRPDAYMQLLDMYLDPQNGKEPMFKAAVRLFHNHGESLDPLKVIATLSPDMPLQIASETILRMLRARLHHHYEGQIVHNVSHALDLDARLARLEERSRHVQINDESLCDSCHARLGTKLFAMYPDDSIVCYKCYRRQGESTSVTGRDFKQDVLIKPGWLVID